MGASNGMATVKYLKHIALAMAFGCQSADKITGTTRRCSGRRRRRSKLAGQALDRHYLAQRARRLQAA
jgi:hypothetical protein